MSKNIIDTSKKLTDSPTFRHLLKLNETLFKNIPKNPIDDSEWLNASGDETPVLNPVSNEIKKELLENVVLLRGIIVEQAETTSKILESSEKQSKNAEIQFKTTIGLMIITIIIGLFSLKPVFFNQSNTEYKTLYEHTIELEKTILKQDKSISELSNSLLDLENQVRTLEKQNGEISKKKID